MAAASIVSADTGKLSFAKVAASASKKAIAAGSSLTSAAVVVSTSPTHPTTVACPPSPENAARRQKMNKEGSLKSKDDAGNGHPPADGINVAALSEVPKVAAPSQANVIVNNTSSAAKPTKASTSNGSIPSQPSSDEVSQKADSNSELGTKPPSLDGKSITSGTTFNALDEKESLRPDDSASVKAAADEDDAFSIRGSLVVNSRLGSELASRVHRIQLGDMPPRIIAHINPEPVVSGVATPQSTNSENQPITEAHVQLATNTVPPDTLNGQSPDEKLLDAMQTPKDRLFLLRLENDVVNFVQNSKEPFMDLPPSNSFCRMLTHKLADYYHMTHSFEAVAGSVRIFRTPFCRVPPPLASLVAVIPPNSSTPPPVIQPRKIMRRGEDGDFTISAGPSKPTSEVGSDSKDKNAPAKEAMTREAREEAYNKARERIFGSSMPTESSTPENDDGTGVSRASSVSAKDKAATIKKGKGAKQRRDDSESFDSRSQYTPYYNHPQQPTWMPPQYVLPSGNAQFAPTATAVHPTQPPLPQQQAQQLQPQHSTAPFPNVVQPQLPYGSATSSYPQGAPNSGLVPQTGASPQYPSQPIPPRYTSQTTPPAFVYPSASQPNIPPQQWQQPPAFNPNHFPAHQARSVPLQVGIPYPYGQLPVNSNPNDPKSQHPIPGSYAGNYNRHAFNPQTQSFIPGGGAVPLPTPGPQMHYGGGMHGTVVGLPQGQAQGPGTFGGSAYQQSPLPGSPYTDSPGSSYGIRQSSTSSGPSYPQTQVPVQVPMGFQGPGPTVHSGSSHGPSLGPGSHGPRNQVVPRGSNMASFHSAPPRGPSHGPVHNHKHHSQQHPLPYGPKKAGAPQGPSSGTQTFSYLPNYGNPATLPQKPATTAELRH